MLRLARTASLLVVFSLLVSAATASAECAWVLWERRLSGKHEVMVAFDQADGPLGPHATCALEAQKYSKEAESKSSVFRGSLFTCLPDTVDPRGPKGK